MKYTRLLILLILLSSSGSTKNQEVPRMKLFLCLSDRHENATVSWFCNSTNIGTCYSGGEINVRKDVKGCQDVEISGPKMLIIPESISGNYSAKVLVNQYKTVLDCYITFPESPGEQRVDVISNLYCELKVACSMEDMKINGTFICENNTCRQEGGERSKDTKSGASLRLYLLNSTIICSHSNQISKTQTTIQPNPTSEEKNVGLYVSLGVLGGFLLLLLLLGVGWCIRKKRSKCGGERSRSEKSLDVPPQSLQHLRLLEGIKVFPSQDEQMELNQVSWSQSGTAALSGKSLQDPPDEGSSSGMKRIPDEIPELLQFTFRFSSSFTATDQTY